MSQSHRMPIESAPSRRSSGWLWALLRQRCPRCRTGRMFRGPFTMNDPCPVCGLLFQREEGYFLGAMYTSYILSSALLTGFYFAAVALLPTWSSLAVAVVALLPFLPLMPAVFRYSRVTWIYFDRAVCPSGLSAGPYEKARERELERGKPIHAGEPMKPSAGSSSS